MINSFNEFEYCRRLDLVDIENDEFQLQSTGGGGRIDKGDGVCITSLTVNESEMLVGKLDDQAVFWIDGTQRWIHCKDTSMSTQQITIKNGKVHSSECKVPVEQYCIRLKSSSENCDATTFYGDPITLLHNDVEMAKIPTQFDDFKYCFDMDQIDIENDNFKLVAGGDDGVCINSLHVGDEQILVGRNNDMASFEFDKPDQWEGLVCNNDIMRTSSLTIQNGKVIESECKG